MKLNVYNFIFACPPFNPKFGLRLKTLSSSNDNNYLLYGVSNMTCIYLCAIILYGTIYIYCCLLALEEVQTRFFMSNFCPLY